MCGFELFKCLGVRLLGGVKNIIQAYLRNYKEWDVDT